ncbi:unnamed protein product [Brassica oleracea var. botrytis]|uniref:(rape) hypothetical protein n=1 Tax=Brassica napus TaxID=3708 RepID=A0A816MBN8_BRANA|nr:unnamed protein product [Brassica napus]
MEERVTGSAPQPFTEKANFNHSDDLICRGLVLLLFYFRTLFWNSILGA